MIRPLLLLFLVMALMASARSFVGSEAALGGSAGVALGFGFLVLSAIQSGKVFAAARLPRLTGYLVSGLVLGPEVAGLLTRPMMVNLRLVNGVAVGILALSAGSELNLKRLRPHLRGVLLVSLFSLALSMLSIAVMARLAGGALPFMHALTSGQRTTAAAVLGVVLSAGSPAVALAMLSETASAGVLSEMLLGVVVLADVAIIVLFAIAHALSAGTFGASPDAHAMGAVPQLAIELFGSMGVGAVFALAIAAYERVVKSHLVLFLLAVCMVSAEIGSRLHLDPLIVGLTAGLLLENGLGVGGEVVTHALAPASLPIFAVFFALAGAGLHVHDLATLWPMALAFAAVRAASLMGGARLGARVAKSAPLVQKWLPLGTIPQAGVAVGLAEILARHFPTWGPGARGLVLAVVTLNEMIGPLLLRQALQRSGEAGKRQGDAAPVEH